MNKMPRYLKEFKAFLEKSYPLNCPPIIVHVHEGVIRYPDGRTPYASVCCEPSATYIDISLARESRLLVMKTFGHEYKHVMQRYLDGDTLLPTDRETNMRREIDAQRFGERAVREYRSAGEARLQSAVDLMVSFGPDDGAKRHVIRKRYLDCVQSLLPFHGSVKTVLSLLGEAIKEHPSYPRSSPSRPMAHNDARSYERDTGQLGVMTGYNKFQVYIRKMLRENPTVFD